MANPRGTFTPELLPEGWFDETLRPEGWFSQDFLEPSSAGIDGTANGVTFTYSNALISGAATASSQVTGQILTTSRSLIAGQAQASSQASGVILSTGRSLIAGSASASSTASGTVLQFSYSVIAGSASGTSDATANGVTLSYGVSLIAGAASGNEAPQVVEWVGDGIGKGRERADKAKLERERELKAIIAKSFDAVTGSPLTPQSAPVTPKQRQAVAKQAFKNVDTFELDASMREIERLVKAYEYEIRSANIATTLRLEDEFMMVALLA